MKQLKLSILILLLLMGSITISASSKNKADLFEANLIIGLKSDNAGLQTSCAYYLGELKSQKAVLPLMKIFRSSENNSKLRSMAALSFLKIGDARGIFIIKREAMFGDSQKFNKLCNHLYKSYQSDEFYNSFKSNNNLLVTKVSN